MPAGQDTAVPERFGEKIPRGRRREKEVRCFLKAL
jgi:hypothetical protein